MESNEDLPFSTLLKLRDTIGSKSFTEYQLSGRTTSKKSSTKLEKLHQNETNSSDEAPEEFSSKHPPKKRQQFNSDERPPRKQRSIDPRFNPRCGTYKEKHFTRNFQFAFDMRDEEIQKLKKMKDDNEEAEQAKYLVQRMENQKREALKRASKAKKIKPIINPDGTKHFPSKREVQAKEMVEKFEELKNSGKLAKHLEKRRKKQAGKERKKMDLWRYTYFCCIF